MQTFTFEGWIIGLLGIFLGGTFQAIVAQLNRSHGRKLAWETKIGDKKIETYELLLRYAMHLEKTNPPDRSRIGYLIHDIETEKEDEKSPIIRHDQLDVLRVGSTLFASPIVNLCLSAWRYWGVELERTEVLLKLKDFFLNSRILKEEEARRILRLNKELRVRENEMASQLVEQIKMELEENSFRKKLMTFRAWRIRRKKQRGKLKKIEAIEIEMDWFNDIWESCYSTNANNEAYSRPVD